MNICEITSNGNLFAKKRWKENNPKTPPKIIKLHFYPRENGYVLLRHSNGVYDEATR
jgi:hypothetical protein